jgi:hypothetical protein
MPNASYTRPLAASLKMKLTDLTYKDNELYSEVLDLINQKRSKKTEDKLQTIFFAYRKLHQLYADIADKNIEALKRGLFIQWYALAEPNYLTGIADLNEQAEIKIIQTLNEKIENNELDGELDWMLNYYLNWDWVFDRFNGYNGLDKAKMNKKDNLPDSIDYNSMDQRGQMGKYWNSLTRFEKNK